MKKIITSVLAVFACTIILVMSGCTVLENITGLHIHRMQEVPQIMATCTTSGRLKHYHCTGCGKNFADEKGTIELVNVTIYALGHLTEHVEYVAPTCESEGSRECYICSRCNRAFLDEQCTSEIPRSQVTIAKLPHTVTEGDWQSDELSHYLICEDCGQHVQEATHSFSAENVCTVCGYERKDNTPLPGNKEDIASSELSIHFIELGNRYSGDCALIKAGDTEVLIDAGSRQSSASEIKEYINNYCTDGKLEYVIATHADQDHIAGLVGTSSDGKYDGILYSYNIGTVIKFDKTNKDENTASGGLSLYGKFLAALSYAEEGGAEVYTGSQCWNGEGGASRTYYLDAERTISMNILYNYYYENYSSDENNYSVCVLFTQQTEDGEKDYLFTGDLEMEGEEYLVEYNALPEVELFKAGHHGSPTSSNEVLLSVIKPVNIVVSCCCGWDEYTDENANQFPSQAFIDRAGKYTQNIYCTTIYTEEEPKFASMNGDIVYYYDKGQQDVPGVLRLWCSNNSVKLKDTEWFAANRTWPEGGA